MRIRATMMAAVVLAIASGAFAVGTGTLDRTSGWYAAGMNLTVNATPGADSYFASWTGDTNGATIGGTQITFTVDGPKAITGNFSHIIHVITASAGANGSINPSGSVNVEQGANQSFTITPDANYHVSDVTTNGVSVGAVTGFTFSNVQAAASINATFAIDQYTVTFSEGANGSRTGGGALVQTVDYGTGATVPIITPDTGYNFDGWDSSAYTNVTSNMTITATYSLKQYQVVFNEGLYGNRTGGGALTQSVEHGSAAVEPVITADTGYVFEGWDSTAYSNVTGALSINAVYSLQDYTLTYLSGGNGSIVGTTPQTVAYTNDGSQVTAVPDTGYHFVDWSDGLTTTSRTDTVITSNMTVTANFAIDTFTFTVTSAHGTPSPSGVSTSDWNSSVSAYVPDSPVVNGTTQYVATGWIGTGSLGNGSGTNTSFTITSDSSITWQWTTNYWIEFTVTGN